MSLTNSIIIIIIFTILLSECQKHHLENMTDSHCILGLLLRISDGIWLDKYLFVVHFNFTGLFWCNLMLDSIVITNQSIAA